MKTYDSNDEVKKSDWTFSHIADEDELNVHYGQIILLNSGLHAIDLSVHENEEEVNYLVNICKLRDDKLDKLKTRTLSETDDFVYEDTKIIRQVIFTTYIEAQQFMCEQMQELTHLNYDR
ncbi:hypothetical protein KPE82_14055 [Acinetobacter baumannii]|uniref:hypothetical protein n=1 Tax=Acinetobacter baumannii TaxID=470 RepID=UPI001C0CC816|nr:hypothetical protein [Acinetobacter baumannii]MBU3096731.1 hypothetical protein [Acinetobacter baumannii]MDV7546424.1 hypothetical protein [Acinetobacter baumannii]